MARIRVTTGLGMGIDNVERDLDVGDGELFVLTGSVERWGRALLRRIAGLEPSKGEVFFGETNISHVAAEDRGVSMVFPSGALYAHLSVRENIGFGLKARRTATVEIKERVVEAAKAMGIEHLLPKAITKLTQAERIRVAMARGLAGRPSVLLLDDPFAGLSGVARKELRTDFLRAQRKARLTTLLVTSDVTDALALGNRIAFSEGGFIRQVGTALDLYERPSDRFVAARVGVPPMNLLKLPVENGRIGLGGTTFSAPPAEQVVLGIRPEALSLDQVATHSTELRASMVLGEIEGARARLELQISNHRVTMLCESRRVPAEGAELIVHADLDRLRLFTADVFGVSIPWNFAEAVQPAELKTGTPAPTGQAQPPASGTETTKSEPASPAAQGTVGAAKSAEEKPPGTFAAA